MDFNVPELQALSELYSSFQTESEPKSRIQSLLRKMLVYFNAKFVSWGIGFSSIYTQTVHSLYKKLHERNTEIVQLGNGRIKPCNLVLALNDMIKYSLFHKTLCLQCTAQMVWTLMNNYSESKQENSVRKEESGCSLEVRRCVSLLIAHWFVANCSLWRLSRNGMLWVGQRRKGSFLPVIPAIERFTKCVWKDDWLRQKGWKAKQPAEPLSRQK